ncbi:ADP-ribosylation factor-like protein 2-binding protein [Aplysia californica]|uniref:ADP-ribosylation factor-like protein 2-binding protein n=1 Tax=Aplysia californica TaxID=6500 RepID=A0ABM0JTE8_APLCA|nr:ADP-ribosylation factor-like protein 2-binding protein [Aplysia californica]
MSSNGNNHLQSAMDSNDDGIEDMDFSHGDHFEEEDLAMGASSKDSGFDSVIGHIEDIIMEESFQSTQNGFLEKYYTEFEDTEENKFCYTDIHKEYISLIETYLDSELKKRIPDFSMPEFSKQLQERRKELEGEIFEILLTFSDFMAFKEMLLDYKADKEGKTIDLSGGLTVMPVQEKLSLDGDSPFCVSGKSLHGP